MQEEQWHEKLRSAGTTRRTLVEMVPIGKNPTAQPKICTENHERLWATKPHEATNFNGPVGFLNWRRARWTASFMAITIIVDPAQSQQTKPAEPNVAAANRAVQSQLPLAIGKTSSMRCGDSSRPHPTQAIEIAGHFLSTRRRRP